MQLDFFPAYVVIDGEMHSACRVVDDGAGRVHVFQTVYDEEGARIVSIAEAALLEPVDARRIPRHLVTDAGQWEIERDSDCRCRDPLKRINAPILAVMGLVPA